MPKEPKIWRKFPPSLKMAAILDFYVANVLWWKHGPKVICMPNLVLVWQFERLFHLSAPLLRPWARRWIKHWNPWRMANTTSGLWLPSRAQGITGVWPVPYQIYCFMTEARMWTTCPSYLNLLQLTLQRWLVVLCLDWDLETSSMS